MAEGCLDMKEENRLQGRSMKQMMCSQHGKYCSSCNGFDEYEEQCPYYSELKIEREKRMLKNGQG